MTEARIEIQFNNIACHRLPLFVPNGLTKVNKRIRHRRSLRKDTPKNHHRILLMRRISEMRRVFPAPGNLER
jgi:hypothetical protein